MADAIADLSKSSGKPPLFYSLCQWGRVSLSQHYLPDSLYQGACRNNHGFGRNVLDKVGGSVSDQNPREYANVYAVKTTNDIGRSDRLARAAKISSFVRTNVGFGCQHYQSVRCIALGLFLRR